MHYCELKDAWGENTLSQHYYSENAKKVLENFQPLKPNSENSKENSTKNNSQEITNSNICGKDCQTLISHVLKCPQCKHQLTKLLVPSVLTKFHEIVEIYREPIVLILMTVFIVLLINMVNKV
jgi:uncharacterized membrane protein